MNVVYVTLIAIAAPVAIIAIFGLPSLLYTKGRDAWRNIPREIYAAHPQRLLGLKISRF